MYEELVKSLREKAEFLTISDIQKAPPGLNIKNLFAETMKEAADAIEALCDFERWIPVTERLPEEWRIVMTYQPTPSWMEDGIGLRRIAVYIGNGKWREAEKHNMMGLPVTHWMPLPEPPKTGKEEDDDRN